MISNHFNSDRPAGRAGLSFLTLAVFSFFTLFFWNCSQVPHPPAVKHVIVIGIDGMSVGGLIESNTPVIDSLMKQGAFTLHARNVIPTSSSPNWSAMLTGSGVAQTGVTSNNWRFDNYTLPPVVTTEKGRFPDIFYTIKKADPVLVTASVYHWKGFANLYDHTFTDIDENGSDEHITALKAAQVIRTHKPAFLFIQLDHVDHAGHESGHMSPGYFESIETADKLAGVIVEAAREAGILEETVFLVVADHGGKGFGHGDETPEGNEVPFIISGKGIKKNYKIPVAVNLYDVAATSAYLLKAPIPDVWQGDPVECAFEGYPEPQNIVGSFMCPAAFIPKITPSKINGEAGGLFTGKNAVVTLESPGLDGVIRYTTDGTIPSVQSFLYEKPFELSQTTVIRAAFFGNDGCQSGFSEGFFRIVDSVSENTGIKYTMIKGENWSELPDFSGMKALSSGISPEISTDMMEDRIGNFTGILFEGFINVFQDGEYTFYTVSDDGSKLYIGDSLVVNNDGDHGVLEKEGEIFLNTGKYRIRVEYFNGGGGFYLNTLYKGPGIPRQIIPPTVLSMY